MIFSYVNLADIMKNLQCFFFSEKDKAIIETLVSYLFINGSVLPIRKHTGSEKGCKIYLLDKLLLRHRR